MANQDKELYRKEGAYTVHEIRSILKIGRNAAYMLANSGKFPVMRIGVAIRIPKKAFDEWLGSQSE